MTNPNPYKFSWDLLGVRDGRPHLGEMVKVEIYRLMQFTLRDVLSQKFGLDEANKILSDAGKIAGAEFYKHCIAPVKNQSEFVSKTQKILKDQGIGILKIEEQNLAEGKLVLTIDEDLDCSGLPELDYETCVYDEGFLSGIMGEFTKEKWSAKEVDCWCTGARTCRFVVQKA